MCVCLCAYVDFPNNISMYLQIQFDKNQHKKFY